MAGMGGGREDKEDLTRRIGGRHATCRAAQESLAQTPRAVPWPLLLACARPEQRAHSPLIS
eukprot:3342113-Pleurochrysis_carterae.AAC.1